jgi:hypothetical protein
MGGRTAGFERDSAIGTPSIDLRESLASDSRARRDQPDRHCRSGTFTLPAPALSRLDANLCSPILIQGAA